MKTTIYRIAVLSLAALALASHAQAARSYQNIIRPFMSVRSAGMGGVRYTTGMYEENFFANPAKIIDTPHWRIDIVNVTAEVNSGAISNLDKLTAGGDEVTNLASTAGSNNHFRLQTVMPAYYSHAFWDKKYAAAIGIVTSTQGDIGLRRSMQLEPNVFTDVGPAVTLARRLGKDDRFAVGVTGHYMYRVATKDTFTTVDYISGQKFNKDNAMGEGGMIDFDLGMKHDIAWQPMGWDLTDAFAVNNVLGGKFKANSPDLVSGSQPAPPKQPRTFNAGVAGKKDGALGFTSATLAFEVQDIGNNAHGSIFRTIHMGGELEVKETIYLRAGLNQGYVAAGVGFDLPLLKVDLSTYGEEMTLNAGGMEDRRYAVRIGLSL
jgi:hypothetical protein